ncbi:hypothetical protein L1987_86705 [Smallanthus sonchifolius]|uniref:Uncharacterized protein n=1 Tax=Smallanthus sonchifolius TaxID=185202 RepID=A0ACB8Y006_9ASTR|nr:hypothetical protein L1987_86705 [Smallanthus sonchifolius]
MSDAVGLVQFMSGLGEIARGATSPSTLPVWQRELLCSSDRPLVTFTSQLPDTKDMKQKSFFFTTNDISAFRRLVPTHLQSCSTFEMLTACLWRCHAMANHQDPEQEMPVIWAVNARKLFNPPLPLGYYGNVVAFPVAFSKARDLRNKPFGYALELLMKAHSNVSKEYIRSVSDLMAIKHGFRYISVRSFDVTDVTRVGFDAVDFGWGKPAYGGPVRAALALPGLSGFYATYTNNRRECGILVSIALSSGVMGRFVKELNGMLAQGNTPSKL